MKSVEKETGFVNLKVNLDMSEADELMEKLKQVNDLMEKANSLLSELASKQDINITLSVNGTNVE